jgi:hypothetical protein
VGVDIPQPFVSSISGSLGSVGPVTVGGSLGAIGPVTVAGLPDTFHIYVEKLPKIQLGVDPITLTLNPVDLNLSIKQFPSIRGHLPADFSVGLSLLGMELLTLRLCGEAQIITERTYRTHASLAARRGKGPPSSRRGLFPRRGPQGQGEQPCPKEQLGTRFDFGGRRYWSRASRLSDIRMFWPALLCV